jgi:hypothetical protein
MSSKLYVGDEGTVFEVDVGTDISAASTTDLKVQKPDGSEATWTGAANGGTNTQIDYTIVADDLDQAGRYRLQSHVVTASWNGLGETAEFVVYSAFN